jgi:uncharacterized protein (UPF0147 family)
MTDSNSSDRLDRIEEILDRIAHKLQETTNIANSNSRTIQAMLEQRETDRLEHERRMTRLEEIAADVATTQKAVIKILASLDEDRPTILRRLMKIEDKVDRILEQNQK